MTTLVKTVILNYMGLLGTSAQYNALFPMLPLGSASQLDGLTVFQPIV